MPFCFINRDIIRLAGDGVIEWLSGLITNEISGPSTFAALLTPQGKIIADFFIYKVGDSLLIDSPVNFTDALEKRLRMYKLRAPITFEDTNFAVLTCWDEDQDAIEGFIGYNKDEMMHFSDPRHPAIGTRILIDDAWQTSGDYRSHLLSLGVPDSMWDFESSKVFPADANMDLLNGVDFKKGCFVGQEVVSRMKRMTTVKKRMRSFKFTGKANPGDPILSGERVIGNVLSTYDQYGQVVEQMGMAMIRLDRLRAAENALTLNGYSVEVMNSVDGLDH